MSSVGKGAILGAAAMLAVALIWFAAADAEQAAECSRYPKDCIAVCPIIVLGYGLAIGVPWGIVFGALLGALADRLTTYRKPTLAVAAPALALALAAAATPFMHGITGPHIVTLFARAFVPLALASLALERWTRHPDPLPLARLR